MAPDTIPRQSSARGGGSNTCRTNKEGRSGCNQDLMLVWRSMGFFMRVPEGGMDGLLQRYNFRTYRLTKSTALFTLEHWNFLVSCLLFLVYLIDLTDK